MTNQHVESLSRHTLMRLVRYAASREVYEVIREELAKRDIERMRDYWVEVMTGAR